MFIVAAILIIAGVALFVAAPLGLGLIATRDKSAAELDLQRLEHERGLAVQGLKELEFDREMGKLSDSDYHALHDQLENRALTAMTSIERLRQKTQQKTRDDVTKPPAAAARPPSAPIRVVAPPPRRSENAPTFSFRSESSSSRRVRFCPQCGTRAASDGNFCAECGIVLKSTSRATNWTE